MGNFAFNIAFISESPFSYKNLNADSSVSPAPVALLRYSSAASCLVICFGLLIVFLLSLRSPASGSPWLVKDGLLLKNVFARRCDPTHTGFRATLEEVSILLIFQITLNREVDLEGDDEVASIFHSSSYWYFFSSRRERSCISRSQYADAHFANETAQLGYRESGKGAALAAGPYPGDPLRRGNQGQTMQQVN